MQKVSVARKSRGLTQKALSERIGVSRPLIAQIEAGHRRFYPLLRKRISKVLGVDEKELTEG